MNSFKEFCNSIIRKTLDIGATNQALLYKDQKNEWHHFGINDDKDSEFEIDQIKHIHFSAKYGNLEVLAKLTYLISSDEYLIETKNANIRAGEDVFIKVFEESVIEQLKSN